MTASATLVQTGVGGGGGVSSRRGAQSEIGEGEEAIGSGGNMICLYTVGFSQMSVIFDEICSYENHNDHFKNLNKECTFNKAVILYIMRSLPLSKQHCLKRSSCHF